MGLETQIHIIFNLKRIHVNNNSRKLKETQVSNKIESFKEISRGKIKK